MKITILGANSFIARNLIYILKNDDDLKGCELYLYDYQKTHLDGVSPYESIAILDKEELDKVNFDVDIIYMFIGKTGTAQGFTDYKQYVELNELSLLNVLDAYVKNKSKAKVVFPSSRLVYKGREGLLREDAEKEAKTVYAANKLACERYLEMYRNFYGVRYATVRICVPYGSMIPNASSYGTAEFMLGRAKNGEAITLYGGGTVRRTLTHMEDLCRQLYLVGKLDEVEADIYNIGGENYSLYQMASLLADKYHVGVSSVEWPDQALAIESYDTVFDSSKLDKITNYKYIHKYEDWIEEN